MTREYKICSRCKQRECENIDGEYQWYCASCNDKLAEGYREMNEWQEYHND